MTTSHNRHIQDHNAAESRRASALGCLTMAGVSAAAAVAGFSGGMGLEQPLAVASGAVCSAASLALGATAVSSLLRS